jgi:hypothetical protein
MEKMAVLRRPSVRYNAVAIIIVVMSVRHQHFGQNLYPTCSQVFFRSVFLAVPARVSLVSSDW